MIVHGCIKGVGGIVTAFKKSMHKMSFDEGSANQTLIGRNSGEASSLMTVASIFPNPTE
jgi:hypothetical protein